MAELGSGDYSPRFLQLEAARFRLLQSVRRLCPLPLFHLRDRIAPPYDRWVEGIIHEAKDSEQWDRSPEGAEDRESMYESFKRMGMPEGAARKAAEGRPIEGLAADDTIFHNFAVLQFKHPGLDRVLKRWAQRHHLTHRRELEEEASTSDKQEGEFVRLTLHEDYWACEWAMFTLWFWKFSPRGAASKTADPPDWIPWPEEPSATSDQPAFQIRPGWDVLTEMEDAFRARLELAVNEYVLRQKGFADARGLVERVKKRAPQHFDWLALYQVGNWDHNQIAEWENTRPGGDSVGSDAIRKGILLAASSCGLNPKPGKQGRPIIRK